MEDIKNTNGSSNNNSHSNNNSSNDDLIKIEFHQLSIVTSTLDDIKIDDNDNDNDKWQMTNDKWWQW